MKIKISQKFDWDTSGLSAYIDENADDLATRLVEQARSVRLMKTLQGIKGTQQLNDIDTDVTWQDGSSCGFNPTGNAAYGKKNITAKNIKVELEFCNSDLSGFWPQKKLVPGASAELEQMPFEQVIMDNVLKKNAYEVDKAVWLGDTTSLDTTLKRIDGLIKQLKADGDTKALNTGGLTSLTNANALAAFQNAFDSIESKVASDERFAFMAGYETIRKLARNIGDNDFKHYKVEELVEGRRQLVAIEIPGTMAKVYLAPGLNGTSYFASGLFGADGEFVVGTDQESDWTSIQSDYDARLESLWLRLKFRLGTTYRFGENTGLFELAAS